jgi:hypothetical protein
VQHSAAQYMHTIVIKQQSRNEENSTLLCSTSIKSSLLEKLFTRCAVGLGNTSFGRRGKAVELGVRR